METIVVERNEGIVTVTLNRPERKNAINGTMWDELLETFAEVTDNPEDRVMVITGAGGAFCSGADLTQDRGDAEPPHQLVEHRAVDGVLLLRPVHRHCHDAVGTIDEKCLHAAEPYRRPAKYFL